MDAFISISRSAENKSMQVASPSTKEGNTLVDSLRTRVAGLEQVRPLLRLLHRHGTQS